MRQTTWGTTDFSLTRLKLSFITKSYSFWHDFSLKLINKQNDTDVYYETEEAIY